MVFVQVVRPMSTMLSLTQKQSQQQKLTPQQLQYLKLLQLSAIALEQRVKEELELNPLLEESEGGEVVADGPEERESDIDWDEIMPQGEYEGYSSGQRTKNRDEDSPDIPQPAEESLLDQLLIQLRMQSLTDDLLALAEEILGNIDADGYLRRDLSEIVDDLNRFLFETGNVSYPSPSLAAQHSFASYDDALGEQPFGRERLHISRSEDASVHEGNGVDAAAEDIVAGMSADVVEEDIPEEVASEKQERTISDLSLEEMANLPIEELARILERGTASPGNGSSGQNGADNGASGANVVDMTVAGAAEIQEPDGYTPEALFTVADAERLLYRIQRLEPPGIGSRDLQECLLVQLEVMEIDTPDVHLAYRIVKDAFHEFTMKHFEKICRKLECSEDELRDAIEVIVSLNPKPGEGSITIAGGNYVTPDFQVVWHGEEFVIVPNDRFIPTLRINANYREMLSGRGKKKKEGIDRSTRKFLREKLESAKWFIASIHQRRQTMLKIMRAIVELQIDFFRHGPNHLKPMIYKDIAERIGMDISTVCRVVNGKYVQTDYGVFELRYFFSEALETVWGEEVSNKVVKSKIKDLIDAEDKNRPLSDEAISERMKEQGYNVARRTVAKYREQMNISVARLRRSL